MEKDLKKEVKEEEIKDVSGGLGGYGSDSGKISDWVIGGLGYIDNSSDERRRRDVVNSSITDNDK